MMLNLYFTSNVNVEINYFDADRKWTSSIFWFFASRQKYSVTEVISVMCCSLLLFPTFLIGMCLWKPPI